MEVIAWALHPDPFHRATIDDLESDPWVQQEIHLENYTWEEVLPNSGLYNILLIPFNDLSCLSFFMYDLKVIWYTA